MCVKKILQVCVIVSMLGQLRANTMCHFGDRINKTSGNSSSALIEVEYSQEVNMEEEGTYIASDKCSKLNNNSCECTLAKCYFSNIICQCARFALEECREGWFHTSCRKRNVFYANAGDLCFNSEIEEKCQKEIIRYSDIEVHNYKLVVPQVASKNLKVHEVQKRNEHCYLHESFIGNGTFEACFKVSKVEISSKINKIISFYINDVEAVHPVDISNLISLAMDNVEICVQFTVTLDGGQGKLVLPGHKVSLFKVSDKFVYFYYMLCGAGEKCKIPLYKKGKPFAVQLIVSKLLV